MRCPICRTGETQPGFATFHHEANGQVVLVRNVPAEVCSQCGESYFAEETLDPLQALLARAIAAAAAVSIYEYDVPVAA